MGFKFTFFCELDLNFATGMKVILGCHPVKAFVVAPKDCDVIGIVRIGLEFGLLAKSHAGNYFRVNGSHSIWLNKQDVEEAIYRVKPFGQGESFSATRRSELVPMSLHAPVVLLKKHLRVTREFRADSHLQPLAV